MVPTKSRYSSKRAAARVGGTIDARPGKRAAAARADGTAAALAELLARGDARGWTVSCYQKLEPADRVKDKYRIKLKNRLRRAEERLEIVGFSHADREAVKDALRRVEDFFAHPSNLDGGRGMAVFAAPGFFRAVPLPYVLKSRVLVDRTPVVGELVALTESRSRVLVVAVDRRAARFFDVDGDLVTELPGMPAQASRTTRFHGSDDAPGWGEYKFHTRIREEKHRHFAAVAEQVAQRLRAVAYDGLLLGGIGIESGALERHLPPAVRDRLAVGTVQLAPRQVTIAEIGRRAAEFQADEARARTERDVAGLTEARATGWAVDGVEATLQALHRGQVAALLVDHDAEVPGFRLASSGRLTTEPRRARAEGEAQPIADVLDDAIEDALRQRARVAVVRGAPARRFARMAGFLRFQVAQ